MKRQTLIEGFPDKSVGYTCQCCGQFVKQYKRHFNSNMGLAMLMLYKHRDKGFVHLENLMSENGYKRCGDASYLRHYSLIQPLKEKRQDGSQRNGYYKITGLGIMFCELKTTVKEKFIIFNNKLEGFEGKDITILDALGEKFNYDTLMKS